MPELPEVETIRRELEPYLVGKKFVEVIVCDTKIICPLTAAEFREGLVGQRIKSLKRRGKYLILLLSNSKCLVIHLRMSGVLLLNPPEPQARSRVVFHLSDGSRLVLIDRRRLAVVSILEGEELVESKLGPEPLEPSFTAKELARRLKRRKAPIKAVLLDQKVIAGIGNMYADEALFKARVHPLRPASDLSWQETERLYTAIISTLRSAIEHKGASVDTYLRPGGEAGAAHFNFKVAHCGGKPCPECGTPVQRLAIRNRGSYFCPTCQKC